MSRIAYGAGGVIDREMTKLRFVMSRGSPLERSTDRRSLAKQSTDHRLVRLKPDCFGPKIGPRNDSYTPFVRHLMDLPSFTPGESPTAAVNHDIFTLGEKSPMPFAFLSAEWRYLLMVNYEIKPEVLAPLVPAGTEIDTFDGRTLVSVVGFLFQRTRVLGMPPPFHRNFEEVNLRFYVKRQVGEETRRGVVFVKEIVPKLWIARLARLLYQENYIARPMRHTIERDRQGSLRSEALVEFAWKHRRRLHRLGGLKVGQAEALRPGSEEEFITEHYWGYTRLGKNKTGEYRVEHPAWRVWQVAQPYLLSDVANLYGEQFVASLCRPPHSAFLAEGSPVKVYPRTVFRV
jgi:uncharacterized protein YqjF (DUF2071 family)